MPTNEAKRAKNDYISEYNKEHKKIFSARLYKDEYEEICAIIKSRGLNKAEFIRYAATKIKEGQIWSSFFILQLYMLYLVSSVCFAFLILKGILYTLNF